MSSKRLQSPKGVIKNHLKRLANINWKNILKDPRSNAHYKEWDFGYVMQQLFFAMLSGCRNLRELETFSELHAERLPDTTTYDIITRVDPEPLRKAVAKQVKQALRSHELPKSEFPIRITVIDGKWISTGPNEVDELSQRFRVNNKYSYAHRVLRAFHASNTTKLFLAQREIPAKRMEEQEVIPLIESLEQQYGRTSLLETYSLDAAFARKFVADKIAEYGKAYIIRLKGNQPNLYRHAQQLFSLRKHPDKIVSERQNGKTVTRELFRYRVSDADNNGWQHLKELWFVRQTTDKHRESEQVVEQRYFLSSVEPQKLSNAHVLEAIRMHWAIENNANWVCDVAWDEDNAPYARKAIVLVSLLRIFAYNVVARLITRRLRKKQHRQLSWRAILTLVPFALGELKASGDESFYFATAFVQ